MSTEAYCGECIRCPYCATLLADAAGDDIDEAGATLECPECDLEFTARVVFTTAYYVRKIT